MREGARCAGFGSNALTDQSLVVSHGSVVQPADTSGMR
jgi:hypothetical protein